MGSGIFPAALLTLLLSDGIFGLDAPTNVRVYSYNLENVLKWDPVKVENVTYTVMYKLSSMDVWKTSPSPAGIRTRLVEEPFYEKNFDNHTLCENTPGTECDFTTQINPFWRIVLRVRAELGELRSDWVETPNFHATRDTTIGPVKSLTLHNREHYTLYIDFEPPFPLQNMPHGWEINYDVLYWRKDSGVKKTPTSKKQVLKDLDPWTVYCVEVTAYVEHKAGLRSDPVCESTTGPALSTGGYIAICVVLVTICVSAVVCFILMNKYCLVIKSWLYPYRIPGHIEQFLENPPQDVCVEDDVEILMEDHPDHISIVEGDLTSSSTSHGGSSQLAEIT